MSAASTLQPDPSLGTLLSDSFFSSSLFPYPLNLCSLWPIPQPCPLLQLPTSPHITLPPAQAWPCGFSLAHGWDTSSRKPTGPIHLTAWGGLFLVPWSSQRGSGGPTAYTLHPHSPPRYLSPPLPQATPPTSAPAQSCSPLPSASSRPSASSDCMHLGVRAPLSSPRPSQSCHQLNPRPQANTVPLDLSFPVWHQWSPRNLA